ncbi:MAG: YebC/PmpR family DNA-binding transcriptional regulator [Candidatus Cloacimonadota bacterium]|nr:MAG: YebC/PmpR family DNA-binding transcriptional regulator [Candidatus Cloacimonadota bacterium]PCJ21029.1 MAG: YebC/PmpR family DNA-binding transcriptional regulator [Candidatus Cloacimonadota bacterium]
MSGHSKWSTIKHKKGANDKARAKVFTKLIREIVTAAKQGGSDSDINPRLRLAIQKAKQQNLPNDPLNRAIKRGAGELDGDDYEEGMYEGYGPNGVGLLVEVLTDNKNRTAADIRHIFTKYGNALGSPGSVSYNFERVGQFIFPVSLGSEDDFMEHVLESGAEDLISSDPEVHEVICAIEDYETVGKYFEEKELEASESDLIMQPKLKIDLSGEDVLKMLKLLDKLEDNDDVQNVYSSFEASDEEMEKALEAM